VAMCSGRSIVEVPYTFQPRQNGHSKIVGRDPRFIQFFLAELVLAARFNRFLRAGVRFEAPSVGPGAGLVLVPPESAPIWITAVPSDPLLALEPELPLIGDRDTVNLAEAGHDAPQLAS
jgi:hypothetical protein